MGWWWFGLSKKSGSVYFFAILEVLGWRGVNYPRPMGSNATIVVIPFMSEFMSLEWVRTPTILLYWALVGARSLSKVKIDKKSW